MVGIISNSAALFAQRNLEVASSQSQSSIARLSSGNRIIKASDDVAGLAIGTVLKSTVTTLKTILTSTSQASSLLSIADSGLKNVGDILQRQKALSVSSNTGSLSNTERAFLQEEFSNLTSEINRLVDGTEFNGIKLIDGGIKSASDLKTAAPLLTGDFIESGSLGTTALTGGGTAAVAGAVSETLIGALSGSNVNVNLTGTSGALIVSVEINGDVYTSGAINVATATANLTVTHGGTGATLNLGNLQTDGGQVNINSAATRLAAAAAIKADIANTTIYQDRGILNTASTTGAVGVAAFDGTVLDGMSGVDFEIRSATFNTTSARTAPTIGAFNVTAENATTDGKISTTIDGKTYSTTAGYFTDVLNLKGANQGDGAGIIKLYLNGLSTNTNDFMKIDVGTNMASATVDMASNAEASSIQTALNNAFGSGDAGGLDFQVGTKATDKITVAISGAKTADIYKDANGAAVTLDISTAGVADSSNGGDGTGSVLASNVLDRAINSITTLRATVGALQSRFEFASANVSSSIQNQEAARSDFLDVDIAAESTAFATAQVRLQASISVLAQANQLPQNLLKLIG